MITWNDFEKVEISFGTVVKAEDFPEANLGVEHFLVALNSKNY